MIKSPCEPKKKIQIFKCFLDYQDHVIDLCICIVIADSFSIETNPSLDFVF